jgi:hypothetical protein
MQLDRFTVGFDPPADAFREEPILEELMSLLNGEAIT